MAFDSFLKIDGIQGESTDSKHQGWIEVLSYPTIRSWITMSMHHFLGINGE